MIRLAPETPTVTALAQQLSVRPSTLMSRFARAGLPSPKNYLAAIRLLHAAFLFETAGLSVADVAYRLEYTSPQSFGRHLRAMLGSDGARVPPPVSVPRRAGAVRGVDDEPYIARSGGGFTPRGRELGGWKARERVAASRSVRAGAHDLRQYLSGARSCGRAGTGRLSAPVIVRAASIALMIASSVACTAASYTGSIARRSASAPTPRRGCPACRSARWRRR